MARAPDCQGEVDPAQRRRAEHDGGAQHVPGAADGHLACGQVHVGHVAPRAVGAVAHAAPLAHRHQLDSLDGTGGTAFDVDDLSGVQRHALRQEAKAALRAADEADVLAVRLGRGAQTQTGGVDADVVLGHVADGEDDSGQRVLSEHREHVGLVLRGVGTPAQTPGRAPPVTRA